MVARTRAVSVSFLTLVVWIAGSRDLIAQAEQPEVRSAAADSAAADLDSQYAKLVADAVTAFDNQRYRESRELLSRAHQLRPNARTLRGMGLAAFEAGRYSLALLDLEAALAETRQPMSPSQRREAEKIRAEAASLTARYNLLGMPADGELRVDDEAPVWDSADSKRVLLLDQGAHTVTLHSAGESVRSWSVQAQGGQTSDLDLAPPSAAIAVVRAPEPAPPVGAFGPVPAPASDEPATGIPNVVAYAALAGAAITGSLAIWQWRRRESEVDDWNSRDCLRRNRTRRANCGEHEAAYQRAEAWAWVAAGATVALSACAVTLLLLNRRGEERQPEAADLVCVPGAAAFACRVSF